MGSNIRFQRGQVWYVDDNYIAQGSIQGKSRPYLVVSNDACNRFSPVIHMAPLTTSPKKSNQPTHIKIVNPRLRQDSWILIEQTMPKSVPDIVDVSDYWFTLSKETMDEVNKALAIQFALKSFGVDVSDFETMLDMIVEQKIAQIQDATQSLLDARMSRYVDGLMDRVANAGKLPDPHIYVPSTEVLQKIQSVPVVPIVPEAPVVQTPVPVVLGAPEPEAEVKSEPKPTPTKKERPASAIDRFNAKWGTGSKPAVKAEPQPEPDVKSEPTPAPEVNPVVRPEITRGKGGRIKWTNELRKQFLEDMASYGPKKVMEIWGLGQTSMYAYQTKFKNMLMDNGTFSESHASSLAPRSRARRSKKLVPAEPKELSPESTEILHDYDNMPLSKFMKKYNIATRAQAVEFAAKLRVG